MIKPMDSKAILLHVTANHSLEYGSSLGLHCLCIVMFTINRLNILVIGEWLFFYVGDW